MKYIKPDYLIRIFSMLTSSEHEVVFLVNPKSAVVMNVLENDELLSATLFSEHENEEEANKARDLYEAAFALYREAIKSVPESVKELMRKYEV
ncbi:hypothetical protein NGC32_06235 [Kluyvera cryocrescens]|uniref:hypothetical protein n=1 Tax=Kluyvera cryocrescens TaxID=580 RepID=UPI002DBFC24D|nr:hypothetical protein [Kluyvera cryocrescens]MEB7712323.1 hypothetical protein [Kluyvera cryocrescens]